MSIGVVICIVEDAWKYMTKCRLVRRDDFYDVFIDGKKYGSGSWELVYTALYFYRAEGFDVKVIE